jgi:hypothetical protein
MKRRRKRPRPVEETSVDDGLMAFFKHRAGQPGDAPLTAEEFMRLAGELEAAQRLARLKGQLSVEPPAESTE